MDMKNLFVVLLVALLLITLYQTVTFASLSAKVQSISSESAAAQAQPSTASAPAPVSIPATQPAMVGGC